MFDMDTYMVACARSSVSVPSCTLAGDVACDWQWRLRLRLYRRLPIRLRRRPSPAVPPVSFQLHVGAFGRVCVAVDYNGRRCDTTRRAVAGKYSAVCVRPCLRTRVCVRVCVCVQTGAVRALLRYCGDRRYL
jgi:hypothetical protein